MFLVKDKILRVILLGWGWVRLALARADASNLSQSLPSLRELLASMASTFGGNKYREVVIKEWNRLVEKAMMLAELTAACIGLMVVNMKVQNHQKYT